MEFFFILLMCFLIAPIGLVISILGILSSPYAWRKWLWLLVLSLGILAYSYEPSAENDLTRYFTLSLNIGSMSLEDAFTYVEGLKLLDTSVWLFILEAWAIGQNGAVHLLPMISIIFVYGISYYITCRLAEDYHTESYIPSIMAFQFCLLPFLGITSNVRNIFAFSIVILAVFLDSVEKRKKIIVLPLYILPVFIHTSSVYLILLRLLAGLKRRFIIFFIGFAILFPNILNTLYEISSVFESFGTFGKFIHLFIWRAYVYLNDIDTSEWAQQVATSVYQHINRNFELSLAIFFIIIITTYINKYIRERYITFLNFELLLSASIVMFMWFPGPHYWRVAAGMIIASGIILIPLISDDFYRKINYKIYVLILFCYAPMGMALQIWANQYTTNYMELIGNFMMTNILTIVYDILSPLFSSAPIY